MEAISEFFRSISMLILVAAIGGVLWYAMHDRNKNGREEESRKRREELSRPPPKKTSR